MNEYRKPTFSRYGVVAVTLHWTIALLIIGMLALGVLMTWLPPTDPLKFSLYQWHKSIGVLIFTLSVVRLGWRLINPPPPLPATMAAWEKRAASSAHAAFYVLMIGMPLLGWMMVSASPWNIPTNPFNLFNVPHLPLLAGHPEKQAWESVFKNLHAAGAVMLALLLVVHVGAALRHHLILRDDVLARMAPWIAPRARPEGGPTATAGPSSSDSQTRAGAKPGTRKGHSQ
ncbi:MAG: cytochrome b [Rhodospirillales bacterium]|nr:cytochrome b [Rhodospirillales bacterium]